MKRLKISKQETVAQKEIEAGLLGDLWKWASNFFRGGRAKKVDLLTYKDINSWIKTEKRNFEESSDYQYAPVKLYPLVIKSLEENKVMVVLSPSPGAFRTLSDPESIVSGQAFVYKQIDPVLLRNFQNKEYYVPTGIA